MATKLKFNVIGDLVNDPVLILDPVGVYEAPDFYQLPHRYYYDVETDSVKNRYPDQTDRQVIESDHEKAIALAIELGLTPPPPLTN